PNSDHQCRLTVPVSAAYQCQSVSPISAISASSSVPISATYQCSSVQPISDHHCSLISVHQ
ncbi:unnamed protein product, partial [Staurois parvus]